MVGAILSDAGFLATDANGAVASRLQITADELATQRAAGFAGSLTSLEETFELIVSDWGKLHPVADGLSPARRLHILAVLDEPRFVSR